MWFNRTTRTFSRTTRCLWNTNAPVHRKKSPNCRAFFKISHDPSRNFRAGAFVKKLYVYKKWVLMGLYCSQYGNYWQIYRHENNIKKKQNKNLVEDACNLYALPVKFRYSRVFSSPEPKARVSYCHSAPSVIRPSVVRPSVNFSHFRLLLQNHWMDFDETW